MKRVLVPMMIALSGAFMASAWLAHLRFKDRIKLSLLREGCCSGSQKSCIRFGHSRTLPEALESFPEIRKFDASEADGRWEKNTFRPGMRLNSLAYHA